MVIGQSTHLLMTIEHFQKHVKTFEAAVVPDQRGF